MLGGEAVPRAPAFPSHAAR
ncbi:hypothetical protein, conserved in T. vivax [Trypanosoma vivax Y486]|uniref:Uncharacterized protein n=1 Tax=Trypanosoma vivax (strain Y486) TaxID=1055687 RepID=F9WT08_TRYVY|nr:hypothetical protein, conserved in T. vivax [Trypanosoma vivax Y486]|eukprot:CCD20697.1 hypothetical protein, conserved in T. vivax [Trypanosoma vivax Y486]